ncbi:MAG: SDR family oxidoreductase [Acidimicrobiia bacterium]|nr:SDR family oxidoreductase [Acidimicrobiia bacterium]
MTGASSGIGRAVAVAFAEEGARLYLTAHPNDEEELAALAREIDAVAFKSQDLAVPDAATAIVTDALQTGQRVDVLVSHAGFAYVEDARDVSQEHWDRLMAVNVRTGFFLATAFAAHVEERGGGRRHRLHIEYECVSTGALARPIQRVKGGNQLVDAITGSRPCPLRIRVNAVLPGMAYTRQTAELFAATEFDHHFRRVIPLGRPAQPEELAPAYVFLASEEAGYITGACLPVDGGLSISIPWPEVDVSYSAHAQQERG